MDGCINGSMYVFMDFCRMTVCCSTDVRSQHLVASTPPPTPTSRAIVLLRGPITLGHAMRYSTAVDKSSFSWKPSERNLPSDWPDPEKSNANTLTPIAGERGGGTQNFESAGRMEGKDDHTHCWGGGRGVETKWCRAMGFMWGCFVWG